MVSFEMFHTEFYGREGLPPLVFLHGLMGSANNFRRIARAFEDQYRILLYDQRGHGRSFKPDSGYAPEDFADDLKIICDHLGWKKVTLVGHSMGGRNAMNFASRFPQFVEKLTIEDIGPDASPGGISRIERLVQSVPTPFLDKTAAREFFRGWSDQKLGQYLFTNIVETSEGTYDWRFKKDSILASVREGRARDRFDEFASLKCPTLLVRGEQSDELSHEVYQRCLEINPRVQGVEIPEAGHWVHFDQPEAFIKVLTDFLGVGQPH